MEKIVKKTKNNLKKIMLIGSIFLFMSACVHGPKVQEFPNTANPAEEIKNLETAINAAFEDQVNVLSPGNFSKAKDSLRDAKKSLSNMKDSRDTLYMVAQGNAYLSVANEACALSHMKMEEVIVARQKALTAGAPGFFPKDFQKTDNKLIDVTSDLEKNKLSSTEKNRGPLQVEYLGLELRAIKQANLGSSKKTIDQALEEGAKDFAPRTLAIAEKSYKDAETFITGNRYDVEQIEALTKAAEESADHLLNITRESKTGMKTSSEETAIQMERERKSTADLKDELKQDQRTNEDLRDVNRDLKISQAFNMSFEEARNEFDSKEADVYKEGNTLVIRLKGLEFPTSQAVLSKSNFKLLAKVSKVIKDFNNSSVVVEGHTDATGDKAFNEKLSTDRAKTITEYFIANGAIRPQKITAIGFGYQKPLATNKTSSGRATNRRVDVLIRAENDE